jgi:hypothetical protein
MRQYYIHDGQMRKGPFDLEHLRQQLIKKETPVWYDGLEDWTLAGSVSELKPLFSGTTAPPPLTKTIENNLPQRNEILNLFSDAQEEVPEKSKSSFLLPILITLIIIMGIVAVILYYRYQKV